LGLTLPRIHREIISSEPENPYSGKSRVRFSEVPRGGKAKSMKLTMEIFGTKLWYVPKGRMPMDIRTKMSWQKVV
jgi:hypothetical protein